MTAYPCPACYAPADLAAGCPRCGWPPDPEAAEVIRLGTVIHALSGQLRDAHLRRAALAASVRARVAARPTPASPTPASPTPAPAAAMGAGPAPATSPVPSRATLAAQPAAPAVHTPETSTRTVQNVLFILGGALLGVAAIVFTAVAWATFGVGGRAAILAGVTGAALGAPLLALRRRLVATAETFAALGLLLVLLDGYAAWYVNLFGVAALPATTYTGVIGAVTMAVALGYGSATKLRGPGYVALAVAQPVLPLLVADLHPDAAGWSLTFASVAAANLALLAGGRLAGVLRILAWLAAGVLLALAWLTAAVALITAGTVGDASAAGAALVAFAAVLWAAPRVAGRPEPRPAADAVLVLAIALAAARVAALATPEHILVVLAALALAVALAVRLLGTGARIGGWIVVAAVGVVTVALTAAAAAGTAYSAVPVWRADLGHRWLPFTGELPAAVALLALAVAALAPVAAWTEAGIGAVALLALAVPAGLRLPWWAPSTADLAVAMGLAALAVVTRPARRVSPAVAAEPPPRAALAVAAGPSRRVLIAGLTAVALVAHGALAGLARPASTAAVAAAVVLTGLAVLARAASRPALAGPALALAMLAWPAAVAATARTAGAPTAAVALAAAGLLLIGVLAVRRRWPALLLYAMPALAVAVLATSWPPAPEPGAVYAAIGVLILGLAGRSLTTLVVAGLLTLRVLVSAAPAWLPVLVEPYGQLDRIWSGPAGTPPVPVPSAVALALTTLAWPALARGWLGGWRGALPAALIGGPVAVLAALGAAHAPWPAVPAVSLLLGLAALLAAALGRAPAVVAISAGTLLTAPALATALATERTTLAALALVTVAAAAIGAAGRTEVARVIGWIGAVGAAVTFAAAAAMAADLPAPITALWLLPAAAAALATSAVRGGRRAESTALAASAHAAAAIALLLTAGAPPHAAAICTLWGVAIGLRALRPGEPAGYRVRLAAAAAACELLAWWLLLTANRVALLEAYTLPAAGLALAAGWLALRHRPQLRSWVAYGPGLAAGLLPSLASVFAIGAPPERRLLVGVAAVVVVVAGAVRRRQAPVLIGGVVALCVALHELALVWQLLATWIPLSVAGLLLVGLAMTYERRRRELHRLRAAVTRMT